MKNKSIVFLLLFGMAFSTFMAYQGGVFIGVVIALATIGFSTTLYGLMRSINNRIILLVWLAIIMIVIVMFITTSVFDTGNIFRDPVRYI